MRNKLLFTTAFVFFFHIAVLISSPHNRFKIGPNDTQTLQVSPPLASATFEWSPWSPNGSSGQGTITYTLSENVNVTTSSTLNFKISGATVTGAYGGENTPPFSFSGTATGNVTLTAGYPSTLVAGVTYSTILSLSNIEENNVQLSQLSLNAQSPSAKGKTKLSFKVTGAPKDQSSLNIYIGAKSYTISTTDNTVIRVQTQANAPKYIQIPYIDGYAGVCNPLFVDYDPAAPNRKMNVSIEYSPVDRSLVGANGTLPGWSDHIALGNFWNPAGGSSSLAENLIQTGQYDFMMVYTDLGAAIIPPTAGQTWTDNNQYIFQNQIRNLVDLCATITAAQNGRNCIPVATLYTANLSGGDIQGCLETMGAYGTDPTYLMQNLAAEASLAYTLENNMGNKGCYTNQELPVKGVIVLNPDYFSYQYQNEGASGGADPALNTYQYNINYVLGFLLNYLETPSKIKGSFEQNWNTILSLQGTLLTIQKETTLLCPNNYTGRYTDTINYMSNSLAKAWTAYRKKYPKAPKGAPLPSWAPKFEDTYSGYIEAVNYLITRYGPNILFGWDCGVYFKGTGKDWVHNNNQSQVETQIAGALNFYKQLPLFNSKDLRVSSNFLVFDLASYSPLNAASNLAQGWLFNGPAFNNWFNYVEQLTSNFQAPGMLWQMSGDPLPTLAAVPEWDWGSYYGSMPNYIFGNNYSNPGSDLNPTTPLTLPLGLGDLTIGPLYGTYTSSTTVLEYLSDNAGDGVYDWTEDHLETLFNSGVFSIQFGGATNPMAGISTESPVPNNGWLLTSVENYWADPNPYPFKSNLGAIKNPQKKKNNKKFKFKGIRKGFSLR